MGYQRLLVSALVIWPIITGVLAFIVAWAATAGLARLPHRPGPGVTEQEPRSNRCRSYSRRAGS
jgi:hypothetical protein